MKLDAIVAIVAIIALLLPIGPLHFVRCGDPRCVRGSRPSRIHKTLGQYSDTVLVGAAVDWDRYDLSRNMSTQLRSRLGHLPGSLVAFVRVPLRSQDIALWDALMPFLGKEKIVGVLALEPRDGLDAVSEESMDRLVELLREYEYEHGSTFILRFGHEMNGNWYVWGQKPLLFKEKFRQLAKKVRSSTKRATMMFCPMLGSGYPYGSRGDIDSREEREMDTNGDGTVDSLDDMFSPYWPGDDVVDVVGGSVYWWGSSYPFGENVKPTKNHFFDTLSMYQYYDIYSEGKGVPMIVTETGALMNTCDRVPRTSQCRRNYQEGLMGASKEYEIKNAWWRQVFSTRGKKSTRTAFPRLRLISVFQIDKPEKEVGGNTVSWGFQSPAVKTPWLRYMKQRRRHFAVD